MSVDEKLSLKKIKIHIKNESVIYTIFFLSVTATMICITSASILGSSVQTDPGDPSHGVAADLVPITLIPLTGSIITAVHLPKQYRLKEWKLYAK